MANEFSCSTCHYFDVLVDQKGKPDPEGFGECNYRGADVYDADYCPDWEAKSNG